MRMPRRARDLQPDLVLAENGDETAIVEGRT